MAADIEGFVLCGATEPAEPREKVPGRKPSLVIRKCEMKAYGGVECKSIGRKFQAPRPNMLTE